jgi:hypothetical protein
MERATHACKPSGSLTETFVLKARENWFLSQAFLRQEAFMQV